jgi:dTDP-glucose pyrophosphorylase
MDIANILVKPNFSIKQTLQIIDKGAKRIAIVIDDNNKVIGTISDGDIRRGILKGYSLQDSIKDIYFKNPTLAKDSDTNESIIKKAIEKKIYQIPIVNQQHQIVDLVDLATLLKNKKRNNKVILMAGGLGSRLRPLTNNIPKPLLKIGDKPILETIINNFKNSGFENFIISVNYKKELIQDYFEDGSKFGVNISYLDEDKRLGTAGALSLLKQYPKEPFFVMNGDLLTNIDFSKMLDFHIQNHSIATMGVIEQEYQIPYGVIQLDEAKIINITEKPKYKYFINGGIYLLNSECLQFIPKNQFFDMPTLFEVLIKKNKNILSFPIHEYWLDIGRMEEYKKAQKEYFGVFCG